MQLRQPVDRLAEPRQIDVQRLVPGDVVVRIPQPVIGGEIDRLAAPLSEDRHELLRFHVWQREEDDVGHVCQPRGVQVVEPEITDAAKMRVGLSERLAGQTIGGHARERDLRMHGEQTQELCSHVTAGSGDSDADHDACCRHYRFEYWNFCRAPGWPYFFRSRMRGSRVRSPAFLSGSRNLSSKRASALESPCRTAPAWPVGPPPPTVTNTSNCPTVLVTSSGCAMIMRRVSRGK